MLITGAPPRPRCVHFLFTLQASRRGLSTLLSSLSHTTFPRFCLLCPLAVTLGSTRDTKPSLILGLQLCRVYAGEPAHERPGGDAHGHEVPSCHPGTSAQLTALTTLLLLRFLKAESRTTPTLASGCSCCTRALDAEGTASAPPAPPRRSSPHIRPRRSLPALVPRGPGTAVTPSQRKVSWAPAQLSSFKNLTTAK